MTPLRIADYEDYISHLSNKELLKELYKTGGVCHPGYDEVKSELSSRGLCEPSEPFEDVNDLEMQQEQDDHDRNCQQYETERYQSASGDYTILNSR